MPSVVSPGFVLAAAVAVLTGVPLATAVGYWATLSLGLPPEHPAADVSFATLQALLVAGTVAGTFLVASRLPRLPRLAALLGSALAVAALAAATGAGSLTAFPGQPTAYATTVGMSVGVGVLSAAVMWGTLRGRSARG